MTTDIQEFSALRDQVTAGLRNRAYVGRCRERWAGQLLVLPAFGNSSAFDIALDAPKGGPDRYAVIHSCWRFDVDSEAFRSPVERMRHPRPFQPTVAVLDVAVDSDEVRGFIEELCSLAVPLGVERAALGVDGVSYEIALGDFWAQARIGWWVRAPEQWRDLEDVVKRMLARFSTAAP